MFSTEFLLTSLVVVLIPGTGVLYTLSTSLFISARASLAAALGCTLGIVPSLLASVFGLAVLFHTSALAFQLLKYAGVVYLLYLAWQTWKHSGALSVSAQAEQQGLFSVAFKGFLINILNPKLTLFFLAFLPQFLTNDTALATQQMLNLGMVFMLMTFIVFVLYGLLANTFRTYVIQSPMVSQRMQQVFAGCFASLAAKLALTDR